jgi:hypothetical protein
MTIAIPEYYPEDVVVLNPKLKDPARTNAIHDAGRVRRDLDRSGLPIAFSKSTNEWFVNYAGDPDDLGILAQRALAKAV